MRLLRVSSSGQSFSAIFSCSACTAPEVTGGENKHDEEGDRRDARGLGPAARDAARAGGDSEYRRRGTRQTSAVQCPRRAAEGEIAIAAPEGEVQPEQRRNEEDAADVGHVQSETPLGAPVGAAGRNPEQRKVRKLRQFFHHRDGSNNVERGDG